MIKVCADRNKEACAQERFVEISEVYASKNVESRILLYFYFQAYDFLCTTTAAPSHAPSHERRTAEDIYAEFVSQFGDEELTTLLKRFVPSQLVS